MLDRLEWAPPGTLVDLAAYEAPFRVKGAQSLPKFLEGSHGVACAARSRCDDGHRPVEGEVALIGRLVVPYAVYLSE